MSKESMKESLSYILPHNSSFKVKDEKRQEEEKL